MIPSHHKHCQKFTEVWPYKSITCYLHICKSLKVGTPSNCCLIYKQFVKWLFLEKTVFIIFEYDLRLSLPEMRLLLDAITFWLERSKVMRFLFSLVHRNGVKLISSLGIVVFWFCFDRNSRLVPSVSPFGLSNSRFSISFRLFRPDCLPFLFDRGAVPPVKARFYVQSFVLGGRQLYSLLYSTLLYSILLYSTLLYSIRQLYHVCRVDDEEDVQGMLFIHIKGTYHLTLLEQILDWFNIFPM